MKKKLTKLVALLLLVALCVAPSMAYAAEARASAYLDSYSAYVYRAGGGQLQVWFDINAAGTVDDVGALTIILQSSSDGSTWSHVKTYQYTTYTNMMAHNTYYHNSHVNYYGASTSLYYRAYVTVWAGKDGGGDSRQVVTRTV